MHTSFRWQTREGSALTNSDMSLEPLSFLCSPSPATGIEVSSFDLGFE
jgi:hypothetical protein